MHALFVSGFSVLCHCITIKQRQLRRLKRRRKKKFQNRSAFYFYSSAILFVWFPGYCFTRSTTCFNVHMLCSFILVAGFCCSKYALLPWHMSYENACAFSVQKTVFLRLNPTPLDLWIVKENRRWQWNAHKRRRINGDCSITEWNLHCTAHRACSQRPIKSKENTRMAARCDGVSYQITYTDNAFHVTTCCACAVCCTRRNAISFIRNASQM